MITVNDATAMISSHLCRTSVKRVELIHCTGKVLGEHVYADRDFPPFDRVSMDGIAVRFEEWDKGRRTFFIEGTQAAGEAQKQLVNPEHCMEVMTGAILPAGCDAVIRYEDLNIQGTEATVTAAVVTPWQSIHKQAVDARKGERLLEPGIILSPAEVALLASVGKSVVEVIGFPKVAIISTGDELVDIQTVPEAHQVRRSNASALQSALSALSVESECFHLEDEEEAMEKAVNQILEAFDVLILSGGVSKGKFDFVPAVLEKTGIKRSFHQVSQRPGKPFWFGRSASGKVAFALPGNPVSTFMCFCKYIKPWILRSSGVAVQESSAVLATDFSFPPPLTYFLQVSVRNEAGKAIAYPYAGGGSGDFANLKNVTGFLELPLEKNEFKAGEVYPYIPFRH